jgi:flagellar hook-length control protein FliK
MKWRNAAPIITPNIRASAITTTHDGDSMETLPVQPAATPAVMPAATSAASADDSNAPAAAKPPHPFHTLLALQLGGGTAVAVKAAPLTDADAAGDDKTKPDAAATNAADALAGLNLPGWLPPTVPGVNTASASTAPAAGGATGTLPKTGVLDPHTAAGDAGARGLAAAADQRGASAVGKDALIAGSHGSEAPPAVHAGATPQTAETFTLPAVPHAAETARAVDANAAAMAAAPAAAPAPAAPVVAALAAPVGTPDWNTELGQKIVWMIGDKQQVAELHVNPPDLGPLDIKLTIDGGQTTAVFTSPHSAVREAVETALPRLREVLADSGLTLGNTSVTADTPRDGQAYAGQRQTTRLPDTPAADAAPLPAAPRPLRSARGMVDLFA